MRGIITIFKRELVGYFSTPVAYVFLVIFLLVAGGFTWKLGGYYDSNQVDLAPFFTWHPWVYRRSSSP